MPFGSEMAAAPGLHRLERLYIRVFGWPAAGLRVRAQRLLPVIETHLEGVRDVLDAGCGRGVFTLALARRFPQVCFEGIDLDPEQVTKGQRLAKILGMNNARFSVGDLVSLDREAEFDMAINIDSIEHISEDDMATASMFRALRPGGLLILHTPSLYRRFLGRVKPNLEIRGHVRPGYTSEELRDLLTRNGFAVERILQVYGFCETLAQSISYAITGAEMRNKELYGLVFPFLRGLAWLGKKAAPRHGNGLLALARRPMEEIV